MAGRDTHRVDVTRRRHKAKGMKSKHKAQIWRTIVNNVPPLIWAIVALLNALSGR